jgi:excinuclease ABC subunit C
MDDVAKEFDGKAFAKSLPDSPGVYRMVDAKGEVVYVGKARSLRKRVASYFQSSKVDSPKTRAMLSQVTGIEFAATHTEGEALILESNLIKKYRPRYNVVLRDDKSYPYIYLAADNEFPRLAFHRGARSGKGRYFGPYPSAGAVRQTLNLLQKLFLVRQCEDSFFRNRSRPCLQYQIKRCTAPCVGLVSAEEYREDVKHAELFLKGRSQEIIDILVERMERASDQLQFEQAARYRDQISQLQRVQKSQSFQGAEGDTDIIACMTKNGVACVQVFFLRDGQHLGNRNFFPRHTRLASEQDVLTAFLSQYYLSERVDRVIPATILVSGEPEDTDWLLAALSERAGRKVSIAHKLRGERRKWLEMARQNAAIALNQRLANTATLEQRFEQLQDLLGLDEAINRIECFDISHTRGEATLASCVVFGPEGPASADYRRFNIAGIEPGDDYAAMQQALTRRYTRIKKEEGALPDILLIDGGKGQVGKALEVLEDLQVAGVCVLGIAKGPSRKPGYESLYVSMDDRSSDFRKDSPALHLIQQVRDEAHRFAITGHRQRRSKARQTSSLETISGIGAKRRRALIKHFGGLQGVARAAVEDLARVPGISRPLARKIYEVFHEQP